MGKRIFIIAPHFPPSSLPPGQRARLLVKHVHKLGFDPTIFTTFSKYREELDDEWLVELAGTEYKKIEVRAISQHFTRKIGFGDLGLRLIPYMLPALIKHSRKEKPDFILYLVPPWYMLVIAPIVKFFNKVPYGIDFIDPWVEVGEIKSGGLKKKTSQWLARIFERKAVKHASIIYSVSEGINKGIAQRYPESKNKPFYAIAYGVEPDDFKIAIPIKNSTGEIKIVRYIGAYWEDSAPVLDGLLKAFSHLQKQFNFHLEFYGTSYAFGNLVKNQLDRWKPKYQLENILKEFPKRVSYREAVKLTLDADFLLIFGGMQPYYAASKLMGLLSSGKIFIAFMHRESFPAKILKDVNYPYLVLYSHNQSDLPEDHVAELERMITEMFTHSKNWSGADFVNNTTLAGHTAFGMTKQFIEPINELLTRTT